MDWDDLMAAIALQEKTSAKGKRGKKGGQNGTKSNSVKAEAKAKVEETPVKAAAPPSPAKKRAVGKKGTDSSTATPSPPPKRARRTPVAAAVAAAPTPPAAPSPPPPPPNLFRVMRSTHPAHFTESGSRREESVVGEYLTREDANEAARKEMVGDARFKGWGTDRYKDQPPPYSSADGPFEVMVDEDEFVDVYVVDIKEEEEREKERARTLKEKTEKSGGGTPSPPRFGPRSDRPIAVDPTLFERNPCRIPGGKSRHPSAYPNYHKGRGSFGFLLQRLSDRNYAMRAHCLDGRGAEYNTYRKPRASYISVVWYPPTNLEDHSDDRKIVDGCHLDLICPDKGCTYLTGPQLLAALDDARGLDENGLVECLFLNGAQSNPGSQLDAEEIAKVIARCRETLLCASLTECKLSAAVLSALASCKKLRGLILENCQLRGTGEECPSDSKLAEVLRSCPDLRWLFVKASIFGQACWDVLATPDACPKLDVLWVDSPLQTAERADAARGNPDSIRGALEGRRGVLKLCMINPDDSCESRYILGEGKGSDRLDGKERSEEDKKLMNAISGQGKSYLSTV
ncbi:hypothetical protein ACHAWF_007894 [Thalassiosira exigua]